MNEFLSLDSLYKYLEENATNYKYLHQIANLFQKVRDKMHLDQKTDDETKAQWEMDVFNFSIAKNVASPLFEMTNAKGERIVHPSYANFVEATYDYIIERLESTNSPLLKARYAHVLWLSPKKHGKYAEIAIDSYMELIRLYEQKDKEQPTKHFGLDVITAIENAFYTALNIKDSERLKLIKSEVIRLVFKFNPESSSSFRLRADLINLMLNEKNVFSKDDFIGLNELCFDFAKRMTDIHLKIALLELGEKIDQKLEIATQNWKQLIGESYEKLMLLSEKNNKPATIVFCQYALKYYRQTADSTKIAELEKKYDKLKGVMEFKKIEVKLNLEQHIKDCEKKAKKIVQYAPEAILSVLMANKNLVPTYSETRKFAEELLQEHPLQKIFPVEIIDERGHNVEYFSSEEEIAFYQTLQQYKMYLEAQFLPLIDAIILEAVKAKKITFPILIDFFQKHSWFGKPLARKNQNQEIKYNWLGLLGPSLMEYFRQMSYLFASGNYPNLTLCTDSLILKIEGLIRDLCNFSGITTFFSTTDKQGRIIYREKDLNALLHDEKTKELFDEDDLLLFKFVLVEKVGYNLRHKIAHSLMLSNEYSIEYMHLLLLLLLKIGKFDFRKKKEDKSRI
jgi:hypothetical protein